MGNQRKFGARGFRGAVGAGLALVIGFGAIAAVGQSASADETTSLSVAWDVMSVATGTIPFETDGTGDQPGNDASASNDVVRVGDTYSIVPSFQIKDAQQAFRTVDDVVLEITAPEGLNWPSRDQLSRCVDTDAQKTSISQDGRTLTCNLGKRTTNATITESFAMYAGTNPNGTRLSFAPDAMRIHMADPDTGAVVEADRTIPAVTISASPRLNMELYYGTTNAGVKDPNGSGVTGRTMELDLGLAIPFMGDKALRGYEAPEQPLTFTLDLANMPAGTVIAQCATDGSRPYRSGILPSTSADVSASPSQGLVTSGKLTCEQTGTVVKMTWTGMDLSASSYPTQTANGSPLKGRAFVGVAKITTWAPDDSFPLGQKLDFTATVKDLVAIGHSVNGLDVPNSGEVLSDNTAGSNVTNTAAGSGSIKYVDYVNGTAANGYSVPQQASAGTGQGAVVAGQPFQAQLNFRNDNSPLTGALCVAWDNATQVLNPVAGLNFSNYTPIKGAPSWVYALSSSTVPNFSTYIHAEYSTVNAISSGTDAERWAAMDAATCGDADGNWSATPPSDLSTVTRIRWVTDKPLPAGSTMQIFTNLTTREQFEPGRIMAVTFNMSLNEVNGGAWTKSDYDPQTHSDWPRGDRLLYASVATAIGKTATNPAPPDAGSPVYVAGGKLVDFELTPRIVSQTDSADTATGVVVTDKIPAGTVLSLVGDHAPKVVFPDGTDEALKQFSMSMEKQSDGSMIVKWTFPSMTRHSEPNIEYSVLTNPVKGGTYVNQAVIYSPDDPVSLAEIPAALGVSDAHYARQSVLVQVGGGIQLFKSSDKQLTEIGDAVDFTVSFANNDSARPTTGVKVIDVLPFNQDSAPRYSDFHGSMQLDGPASVVDELGDVDADSEVEYTLDDPTAVMASQTLGADGSASYGAGITWLTAADLVTADMPDGDFSKVTAIRVNRSELAPAMILNLKYAMVPHDSDGVVGGNKNDDVYTNDATMRTDDYQLGLNSNLVAVKVLAGSIGDTVWEDVNRNGLQDSGEPGIAKVEVKLTGTDKNGDAVERTTTTDASGHYLFDQLISGDYTVTFDLASSADSTRASAPRFTKAKQGSEPAIDSDADVTTGESGSIKLADPTLSGMGDVHSDIDAGIYYLIPHLTVTKTSDPASGATVKPGDVITYTLTATNDGELDLSDIVVADDLSGLLGLTPNGMPKTILGDDVEILRGEYTVEDAKLEWNLGLDVGQSATLTYSVTVNPALTESVDLPNVIDVSGSGPEVPDVPTNCAADSTDPKCSTDHTYVPPIVDPTPTPTVDPTDPPMVDPSVTPTADPSVIDPSDSPSAFAPPSMPSTGADLGGPIAIALALLVLGGVALLAQRRRRA